MRIVNMHEAKTHLSRLVREATEGKPFIIARAGKPLVKVTPVDRSASAPGSPFGFLDGQIEVPDDFDTMCADEIRALFEGDPGGGPAPE